MLTIRNMIAVIAFFAIPQAAFGYTMTHDYYNRFRPGYGSDVYVQQLVQYTQSSAELSLENKKSSSELYSGYALHTGLGIEHGRFLQTGIYYSNVQQTGSQNRLNELRGHEMGAEAKFVLQSPFVNIVLGGGAFYTSHQATRENAEGKTQRSDLAGQGYRGSVEVVYYTSSRVSLVLSAVQVVESYKDKSDSQTVRSVQVKSTRAGAGLSLWL